MRKVEGAEHEFGFFPKEIPRGWLGVEFPDAVGLVHGQSGPAGLRNGVRVVDSIIEYGDVRSVAATYFQQQCNKLLSENESIFAEVRHVEVADAASFKFT